MQASRSKRLAVEFWASRRMLACLSAWQEYASVRRHNGQAIKTAVVRWCNVLLSKAFKCWLAHTCKRLFDRQRLLHALTVMAQVTIPRRAMTMAPTSCVDVLQDRMLLWPLFLAPCNVMAEFESNVVVRMF